MKMATRRLIGWDVGAVVAIVTLALLELSGALDVTMMTSDTFKFTQAAYNASISENAVGRTYVTPMVKMGIVVTDPMFNIRYKVDSGDDNNLFKADERIIGDFCFLRLRLRTGSHSVINREMRESYKLVIKARGDYGHNSAKWKALTEVTINVLDENDLSPIFFESTYDKRIPETTPLHASIAQVEASDADIGVNGEIYYSFAEKTEMFAIHPTKGIVFLARPLTYSEDNNMYEFQVHAKDRGPAPWGVKQPSTATLRVEVLEVNFHSPVIKLQELPSVIEHGEVDTVYAILYVHDADIGINGQIRSVEIVDGDPDNYFRLNPGRNTWEFNIEVAHQLDREVDPAGFNLTLQASDKGNPPRVTTETIHVKLQDTNDQTPVFEQAVYEATIKECVLVNTPLTFVKATDMDFSKNAEIKYRIRGDTNGWFKVNAATGLISVASPLDAELEQTVTLVVVAEDQGNMGSRRSATTQVSVTIQDCNDNAPVFDNVEELEVELDEGKPVGWLAYQVKAQDADQGENGHISYTIANVDSVPFDIDHFSGRIITKEVLDYEYKRRRYRLHVRASDQGRPFRRETETTIIIKIKDVNDNRPQFEKADCKGYVSNDAPIGTSLVIVPAIDLEVTNIISYSIISGNSDGCFDVVPQTGEVRSSCDFRRVGVTSYSLEVMASDGTNQAENPASIDITIVASRNRLLGNNVASFVCQNTDVHEELTRMITESERNNAEEDVMPSPSGSSYTQNRNSPRFPSSLPRSLRVKEGLSMDTTILNLTATDGDQGFNGRVLYVISDGNAGDVFTVETYTGLLKCQKELDREVTTNYTLEITASDMGSPPKSTFKVIEIWVDDTNDNAPVFDKNLYKVTVREDHTPNSDIIQVHATDADYGINAQITYSLTSSRNFTIDPTSGMISVVGSLDRETQAEYDLQVLARDRATEGRLSSTARVVITVSDINDNSPQFQMSRYSVHVREDLPVGTVIMTIQAEDLDEGSGGEVRYALLDGMDDKFEIDRITGVIRIAKELDFETKQIYNITARAKDRGEISLSSRCEIIVEIVDVNENLYAPTFADFVFQGRIKENEPVNTIVMQLIAIDHDAKRNQLASPKDYEITYHIQNGSGLGLFTIDSRGNIRTTVVLDRETQSYYWLTIIARDHGTIPRSSMVEVLIEVEDVNDNVPQTTEPVYYSVVMENSPEGSVVVKLEAHDLDDSRNNQLSYEIIGGNPQGFFEIDKISGLITTTQRKLDRESQQEHILEVNCSDSGVPKQSSTTRVVITVVDVNDNVPQFTDYVYRVRILEQVESSNPVELTRVVAFDRDSGPSAEITYDLVEGEEGAGRFTIHPQTGVITSSKSFTAGETLDITVIAKDNGRPQRESEATVRFDVVAMPTSSPNPPVFTTVGTATSVMENDIVGHMVTLISAEDEDGDKVWYSITAGNTGDVFRIDTEGGNIILAGPLDWETTSSYNLTIQATDGVHRVYTWAKIMVLDINDNRPTFEQPLYRVEVPETTPIGTEVLTVTAQDADQDRRLFYTIHSTVERSSLNKFRINSETDSNGLWTGVISTLESLDREVMGHHELTVMVRDQGHPSKRSFARVMVVVRDNNDHSPLFLADSFQGSVFQTAPGGTAVVQVLAADRDSGANAQIMYSIVSGNAGAAFHMDPSSGIISVATSLDTIHQSVYNLVVRATDGGTPSLSTNARVNIQVTVSDNAPPKFTKSEYTTELLENSPELTQVVMVSATSRSSVLYDIVSGNEDDYFAVVPSAGFIYTMFPIDYEEVDFFNLTIRATNMAGVSTECSVVIHILDQNDNAPEFVQEVYEGVVSEEATPGAVVLGVDNTPLVIRARDRDSGSNAFLSYTVLGEAEREIFSVEDTGAVKTRVAVDHERAASYEFAVQVMDRGQPHHSAQVPATVRITILDVNDSPPAFSQQVYTTTLLLSRFDFPAYRDVEVLTVLATDPDLPKNSPLTYSIISGNEAGHFRINQTSGTITVATIDNMLDKYVLLLKVSDGRYQSQASARISVDFAQEEGLRFSHKDYYAEIQENLAGEQDVSVVQAVGHAINEHLTFSILNPSELFQIGETSGVVRTTGRPFDRERQDNYTLTVAVRDQQRPHARVAHAVLHVQITDVNDNMPVLVHQPYYAIVSIEAAPGTIVKQVSAIDRDIGDNGQVSYMLLDNGDGKFVIDEVTGEISVNRNLVFADQNKEYTLIVQASDHGSPPLRNTAEVQMTIRNEATPIFSELYYRVSVPENVPVGSAVLTIEARSPKGRKLIYAITHGDQYAEFSVQFETDMEVLGPCSIVVHEELDYEFQSSYELTISATDFQTGAFSETVVHIDLEDVNDNAPSFQSLNYISTVSEAVPIGTSIVTVNATDADQATNAKVHYHLEPTSPTDPGRNYFHIEPEKGLILTKMKLDREVSPTLTFVVVATDSGLPPLSSSVTVTVQVTDLNDNMPKFEQPVYEVTVSDLAHRGQFVTRVMAADPDTSDVQQLAYAIVGGDTRHTFSMDSASGILSLSSLRTPDLQPSYTLNVSVTDGVFSSNTRILVIVEFSNSHVPTFSSGRYDMDVVENAAAGTYVGQQTATDRDLGVYGELTYAIDSQDAAEIFRIDPTSGKLFTLVPLDREEAMFYSVPVTAADGGGRVGHTVFRVNVADQGDHKPQFLQSEYKANIYASHPVNDPVLQIQAKDHDLAFNGVLEYAVYGGELTQAADYFQVDASTGSITLAQSVVGHENQLFQFFVRGQDGGSPPQHSDVPVDVYVMGAEDHPPEFPAPHMGEYFVDEDSLVGSLVAAFQAESNETLVYSIVPGELPHTNNPAKFTVSNDGKISILEPLDRETTDRFDLTIKAETKTSPPLVAFTRMSVLVRDKNDNSPKFESNPYTVSIVENIPVQSTVIQVVAHDADVGAFAQISYDFAPEDIAISSTFAINPSTGWISTLVDLDRETDDTYTFAVIAKDQGSNPQLSDITMVTITIIDHNDEPPVFTEQNYRASVNEDALPGTIIRMVSTRDRDLPPNDRVMYSIVAGDPLGQFNVRETGEIYVNRELDRETQAEYELTVAATDGAFVSTATITMTILDANDNTPVCTKATYYRSVSEDTPHGYLLQVEASDADERNTINSKLSFSISGDPDNVFSIREHTGFLTIEGVLDRETTPRYHLVTTVMDGGGLYCTSDVHITVTDENDNAPVFTESTYTVQVPESAEVNSLLVRVSASDADTGINRKVKYAISDRQDQFKIDQLSGIVSLNHPLDRETRDKYNVTVYAYDMGTPRLTSSAQLMILVLDINDNPPEFERTVYSVTVSEALPVGASVAIVYATSKDTGVNAQISYSIVGGNQQNKFDVNPNSGLLSVRDVLDYETLREYVLNIEARDGGTPALSSNAVIKVNVSDANDNAPEFSQSLYEVSMLEDIPVNSLVLQVLATDLDGASFGDVLYSIADGDPEDLFEINPESGYIYIVAPLDRETVERHELLVEAVDSGVPKMTGTTTVHVTLLDINDSPPAFLGTNHTAVLQENKEIGSEILRLEVHDPDLDPNGPPFTFDIVSGNEHNEFYVDSLGILSTAATFNRHIKDTYHVTVRVYDNGSPPLHSDAMVTVQLVEESTFAPTIADLSIAVSAFNDEFPGGTLGRVQATDPDPYDELLFAVDSEGHLFDIDSEDGRLQALQSLDAGTYNVTISVTDGKFITKKDVVIRVNNIDSEMAENGVVMRFAAISPEDFVDTHRESFILSMASELGIQENYVKILSMQPVKDTQSDKRRRRSASDLDVLVAIQKSDNKFVKGKKLRRRLERAQHGLEQAMNVKIVGIIDDVCEKDSCSNGECVTEIEFYPGRLVTVETDAGSFVYLEHGLVPTCSCLPGYGGPDCLPSVCNQNLCPEPMECRSEGTTYRCQCPEGTYGDNCELQVSPPCTGEHCQGGATTFLGESYISWSLTVPMERRLSLSLDVRTEQSDARLMHARGRVDYSFLELVDGMVQYRFDCGNGEGLARVDQVKINDGRWHSISVQRIGASVNIVVDDTYDSNEGRLPGKNDVLNLDNSDVYFGAEVEKTPSGYEAIREGFVGCLRDIRIENEELKVSGGMSVAILKDMKDVDSGCHLLGVCSSRPCENGGRCIPLSEDTYDCQCSSLRYKGPHCEYDSNPCASHPCLNGGSCEDRPPNDFYCYCLYPNKGRRCEMNCDPSPCQNGATCSSSPNGPVCQCTSGYTGSKCEVDVNECLATPSVCKHGGRCINTMGAFFCNCTSGHHGPTCDDLGLADITSSRLGINQDEILIITGVILGVVILVAVFVFIIYCRRRRRKKRARHYGHVGCAELVAETEFIDNFPCKAKNERDSPVQANNLAMCKQQSRPPPIPCRPVSYTASGADSMNTLNMASNLESFRDYGSAADELEAPVKDNVTIPLSLRNVDPVKSKSRQPHQAPEEEPLLNINNLNYAENYPSDMKKQNKYIPSESSGPNTPRPGGKKFNSTSGISQYSEDDLAGKKENYQWDMSDWNPTAASHFNNDMPTKEALDSPPASQHSDDSNVHVQEADYDYNTDYNTDYVDEEYVDGNESEYVGDSEYAENELDGADTDDPDADYPEPPNFQEILALQGQLRYDDDASPSVPASKYNMHPNDYLPQLNISENNISEVGDDDEVVSDNDDEDEFDDYNGNYGADNFARDDADDVIYYGFPRAGAGHNKLVPEDLAGNRYNVEMDKPGTFAHDDMSVSMGGYTSTNASCSDISAYGLCDIDDSEANNSDDNEESQLTKLLKHGSDNPVV